MSALLYVVIALVVLFLTLVSASLLYAFGVFVWGLWKKLKGEDE